MALSDPALSPVGRLEQRLYRIEQRLDALQTSNFLRHASVGEGGIRFHSGGGATFHQGGGIEILDGGDVEVQGDDARIRALDSQNDLVFEVVSEPASLFLRQELITDVAVKIFADRIVSDVVNANESTSSSTFTDLTTVGPTVSVEVSATGLAIVFLASRIGNDANVNENIIWGFMDFDVSGATTRAATFETSLALVANSADLSSGYAIRAGIHSPITVNPGLNTFKAKYSNGGAADPAHFDDRRIMVIGF